MGEFLAFAPWLGTGEKYPGQDLSWPSPAQFLQYYPWNTRDQYESEGKAVGFSSGKRGWTHGESVHACPIWWVGRASPCLPAVRMPPKCVILRDCVGKCGAGGLRGSVLSEPRIFIGVDSSSIATVHLPSLTPQLISTSPPLLADAPRARLSRPAWLVWGQQAQHRPPWREEGE